MLKQDLRSQDLYKILDVKIKKSRNVSFQGLLPKRLLVQWPYLLMEIGI